MGQTIRRVLFAAPWWHEELMYGVARHAAARGWHLNLDPAFSGQLPDEWEGDGILTTIGDGDQFERFWRRVSCPAVALTLNCPELKIARVGFDNFKAGCMAAEHFLQRGFTSFAFYDRYGQHAAGQRRSAFAQTLAASGYGLVDVTPPSQTAGTSGAWTARQLAIRTALQQNPRPLAVFAVDDASGVEVIEACQSLGLEIPYEVGVLGMLDMKLFRLSSPVAMSSISVDFDANARRACELLESMMNGQPPPRRPILFPPTGIAVRASTDVVVARHPGVARAVRFIIEHHDQMIDMPQVIAASGMSHTQLYAAFKRDLGQSPAAFLNRIRLERAKRLLAQTKQKVAAIARTCGFGDRINLYRQFSQQMGMSPGQYRRESKTDQRSVISDER